MEGLKVFAWSLLSLSSFFSLFSKRERPQVKSTHFSLFLFRSFLSLSLSLLPGSLDVACQGRST